MNQLLTKTRTGSVSLNLEMKEYSSPQERALNALFCYTGIIMNEENVERDTRQRRKWCKTD